MDGGNKNGTQNVYLNVDHHNENDAMKRNILFHGKPERKNA